MSIAFFDLGTRCGYAWGRPGSISSGEWDLQPSRFESWGHRFIKFRRNLDQLHKAADITAVGYEAVRRHLGVDAAHCYGGYMGALQTWCIEHSIPFEGVLPGTLKKFWTGSGSAKKNEMIEAARRRGFEVAGDNEADALAGLHWLFAQGDA
jgi:Holliday junction resolvasome RuvABC endonuclease subunit